MTTLMLSCTGECAEAFLPALVFLRNISTALPRTRSLAQAAECTLQSNGSSIARSVDAPVDPYDIRHRDTDKMPDIDVQHQVQQVINRAGARATEALTGRAGQLAEDPAWHHNRMADRDGQLHDADDWVDVLMGRYLPIQARAAIKKMFPQDEYASVGGTATAQLVSGEHDTHATHTSHIPQEPDVMHGHVHGAREDHKQS